MGFRIKICLNGNNPAPDPYVTHIAHRAFSEQQPACFVHIGGHVRGRGGEQGHVKVVSKIQNMNFWVLLLLLALLSGLVSSGFFCACLGPLSYYCSVLFAWLFAVCCSWSPCKFLQGSSSFCFSWLPNICLCVPLLVLVLVMPIFLSLLFFPEVFRFLYLSCKPR